MHYRDTFFIVRLTDSRTKVLVDHIATIFMFHLYLITSLCSDLLPHPSSSHGKIINMISGTYLLIAAFGIFLWYFFKHSGRKNLPPGPKGLPILGNVLQLDKLTSATYAKWAKEYGPIFQIKLITTRSVVLSDYKLIKEAFNETTLSGRMDVSVFDVVPDGSVHGVFNTDGERWEQIRRFTSKQLRDFGAGKNSMEEAIMTDVNEFIDSLKTQEGKPISELKDTLLLAAINSLWFIITGKRYKQTDPYLIALSKKSEEASSELLGSATGALMLFVPWVAKVLPSSISGLAKIRKTTDDFCEFFRVSIEEHKSTYSEDCDRDFIDSFLREIRNAKDSSSAFYDTTGEANLIGTLLDLYFAGSETTGVTQSWLILYLTKMPEIQKKLQEEIESVTGKTRQATRADRPKMPYTEAVIAETHRFASIVLDGVAHRAMRDFEFKGYFIPKDTLITPNYRFVHHDPAVWGDPQNFRPERFLSNDGKTFVKHEALIPFSVGKRVCIGEAVARDTLFLFTANLFQRFNFAFDTNGPDHGYEPQINIILSPKPFNVIVSDRLA